MVYSGSGYLGRYLHGLADLGGVPKALSLGGVEVHAGHALGHLAALLVVGRADGLAVHGVVEAVHVQLLALRVGHLVLKRAVAALSQGGADKRGQLVHVYADAGRALDHTDDLLLLVHLHTGGLEVVEYIRDRALHKAAHGGLVDVYLHFHARAGDHAAYVAAKAGEDVAVVAVVVGRLRGLLSRDGSPGLRGLDCKRALHRQGHGHRLVLV